MQISFYAPLKPPDHPTPSGDRQVGGYLLRALREAGHEVEIASRLSSREATGDLRAQERLRDLGGAQADALLRRYRSLPPAQRPDLWFTYHLYYKAPDWIGPKVAARLGIPYVAVEASVAPKRAAGPWSLSHQAVISALGQAALVITLNPGDDACLPQGVETRSLRPFLDTAPYRAAADRREDHRTAAAGRLGLDAAVPRLLTVAMMRDGDKLASYRILAEALKGLSDRAWYLLIAGDGEARDEVAAAFRLVPTDRLRFLGEVDAERLPALYAACDLLVWPAVKEAFGMALLEAQATGLPVVAGQSAGVAAVVRHGETGLLTAQGSAADFAAAVARLLDRPAERPALAAAAARVIHAEHGLEATTRRLDQWLRELAA